MGITQKESPTERAKLLRDGSSENKSHVADRKSEFGARNELA